MPAEPGSKKELYYTTDHEWIDFQGTVAYVGVCTFKLTGFKEIQFIRFKNLDGFKKQGDILISIQYKDYWVDVGMPVNGKIDEVNDLLITGDKNMLLKHAEGNCWIVKVVPENPYNRKGLLSLGKYQMKGNTKGHH